MCAWKVIDPEQLGDIELFRRLTPPELSRLAGLVSLETYRRNDLIVAEGAAGDRLFVIVDGAVRVSREIPGVGEEALAILPAGSYFGEMALFGDHIRSANVYADRSSELLVIYIDELRQLMETTPPIAVKFLWSCAHTLAERLRQANAKVSFLSAADKFN